MVGFRRFMFKDFFKKIFFLVAIFLLVFSSKKVLADPPAGIPPINSGAPETSYFSLPKPLADETIASVINRIAGYLTIIATPIATIMFLIAAFKMMTASDKPEKRQEAIRMIIWTAIGYAIILIGTGITSIIEEILNV